MPALTKRGATILLVEDDEEDRWVLTRAFERSPFRSALVALEDGRRALDFLRHQGEFRDAGQHPRPDLVLLDLNLPVLDGREVLRQIKSDPALRSIPVVVLTTSRYEADVVDAYALGVNSYISKPAEFNKVVDMVREIGTYWLRLVLLPPTS